MAMKLHQTTERLDVNDANLAGSMYCDANLSSASFKQISFAGASVDAQNGSGC